MDGGCSVCCFQSHSLFFVDLSLYSVHCVLCASGQHGPLWIRKKKKRPTGLICKIGNNGSYLDIWAAVHACWSQWAHQNWAGAVPTEPAVSYPSSTAQRGRIVLTHGRNCHRATQVAGIAPAPLTAALCAAQELSADFIPLWPPQLYLFGVFSFTLFACKL